MDERSPRDPTDNDLAARLRRDDPDRLLCALFAPPERRDLLFLLALFNHETARARAVVSEPAMAFIRLQWWREVIEGAPRRHELATPLTTALQAGQLTPAPLLRLLDARETDAEDQPPENVGQWRARLEALDGELAVAQGLVLGATGADLPALRMAGAAYGAALQLRGHHRLAAQGRCVLPIDVLAAHDLTPFAVVQRPPGPALAAAHAQLATIATGWLAEARAARLPRALLPAALPAVLARRDLRQPRPATPRGVGDRLAVLTAALRGRL